MSGDYFEIKIRDSTFHLLPERAVFWPSEEVLICSDLHWGRELFLQKYGMPIPEVAFVQERQVLETLIEKYRPKEWWILGDFIHHPMGLPDFFWSELKLWLETLLSRNLSLNSIRLVPGNHDRGYLGWTKNLPIEVEEHGILRKSFSFKHEPIFNKKSKRLEVDPSLFSWYGHLHPAIHLPLIGQKKIPCFWIREYEAFLPAFSRLAGGEVIDPDFSKERAIAIGEGTLFEW